MKKLFFALIFCTAMLCGCSAKAGNKISETALPETSSVTVTTESSAAVAEAETTATVTAIGEINTEILPIVMVVLYENYAWGEEQEIKIIDSNGSRYYYSDEQEQDNSIWFDFDEKDWYNTLCNIAKLGEVTELGDEKLAAILDFSEKYKTDITNKYKEYESGLRDYGNYFLYGIYNDGGKPKYVLLSQYGNGIKCLDDEDVINFVNQMIDFGIFSTAHHDFKY